MLNVNEHFRISKACYFFFIYRKTELVEYKIRMRCLYWYLLWNLHNTIYVFANVWADVQCDTKFLSSMTCVLRGTTTIYSTCADEGHCMFLEVPTFLLCFFLRVWPTVIYTLWNVHIALCRRFTASISMPLWSPSVSREMFCTTSSSQATSSSHMPRGGYPSGGSPPRNDFCKIDLDQPPHGVVV